VHGKNLIGTSQIELVVKLLILQEFDLLANDRAEGGLEVTLLLPIVAMRVPGLFDNYGSCPDFTVNTLGTCKHIEALLLRLRRRRGKALDHGVGVE
jgi:hypothetical protein